MLNSGDSSVRCSEKNTDVHQQIQTLIVKTDHLAYLSPGLFFVPYKSLYFKALRSSTELGTPVLSMTLISLGTTVIPRRIENKGIGN